MPHMLNRTTRLLSLCALILGAGVAAAPALRAQDAAKKAAADQPKTVTCTVTIKQPSPPLAAALDLYRTGKLNEAIAAYNAIIITGTTGTTATTGATGSAATTSAGTADAAAAYAGLARVYLKQEKPADAYTAALKGVALTPDKPPAIVALGEVYFRQGKFREAEESYLKPLMNCDVDAREYLGLAQIYYATSNYKRAADVLKQAYKLDPDDPDVQRDYMDTLTRSERLKFLKDYLSRQTNEDAEEHTGLQHELSILEDESAKAGAHCRLTTKLNATETPLETLLDDPVHVRGYGLKVKFNGTSARLLLDTGAGGILIDRKIAEKAGIKKVLEIETKGIGDKGGMAGYLGFADSIQIGGLEFQGCYVDVVNRGSVIGDEGLIGADVFASYLVDIDFPNAKFKLTQLPPYPDEAGAAPAPTLESEPVGAPHLHDRYVAPEMKDYTRVYRFGHMLLIPTRVNNSLPMMFLIDTGAFDNSMTPLAASQVTKISGDDLDTIKGISGEVKKVYVAHKANLQFANFRQNREDLITFSLDGMSNSIGTEIAGVLGFRMLFMLDIKIDYRDGLVDFALGKNIPHH
jgi:tetratricopeptide (TPR) repeat protein